MNNNQKGNSVLKKGIDKNNLNSESEKNISPYKKAEEILAILDLNVEIPANLTEKFIGKFDSFKKETKTTISFDFMKYLQIAALLIGGIFFGILLGKNADIHSFNKKQNREKQALIELRKQHHLSEDYTFGRL